MIVGLAVARVSLVWLLVLSVFLDFAEAALTVDLESWMINIDTGTIYLAWNSGMDISSLDCTKITIQQNQTVGPPYNLQSVSLTANSTSYSLDGPGVEITLGDLDRFGIQGAFSVAVDKSTSWITLATGAMVDLAGTTNEALLDGKAIRASAFVDDYTVPYIETFSLNMDSGIMTVTFNEVINANILDTTGFTIRQYRNATLEGEGISYTLSATSVHALRGEYGNSSTVPIVLSITDLNNIKLLKTLAVDENCTWLTAETTVTTDMSGKALTERDKDNAIHISTYTPDRTKPQLQFFSLDTNVGIIRFLFQEAVDIETLDVTQITICAKADCSTSKHTLSNFCFSPPSATSSLSVIVVLHDTDLAIINADASLALDRYSTFLSFTETLVTDLAPVGNPISWANLNEAISQAAAYPVDKYIKVGLTSYNLDMDGICTGSTVESVYGCATSTGILTLYFNDIVDGSTLDVASIRLMEAQALNVDSKEYYNGKDFFALTPAYSTTASGLTNEIVIHIAQGDLDQIKLKSKLAMDQGSTYLDQKSTVIKDQRSDDVTPYVDADVLNPAPIVSTFNADVTPPSLLRYNLNMDTGRMDLYFSETVDVATLDVTKLVLQAQRTRWMDIMYRFQNATVNVQPNGIRIELVIANLDLNTLKVYRRLAHMRASTYLVVEAGAIKDMAGVAVNPIPDGNAMLCRQFTADHTQPLLTALPVVVGFEHTTTLTHWTMDMDTDKLIMYFSEPVDSTLLNASGLVLHSQADGNGSYYQLGRDSIVDKAYMKDKFQQLGINSVKLELSLGFKDRNQVAVRERLCVSKATCWLQVRGDSIQDMAGNAVADIPSVDPTETDPAMLLALQTEAFTPDVSPPWLMNWTLDLSGTVAPRLELHFNEAVKARTLNISRITIQLEHHKFNAINGTGSFRIDWTELYTLTPAMGTRGTPATQTLDPDGTSLTVLLSDLDTNAIKRRSKLARDTKTSWLTLDPNTVMDMVGFPIVPILDGAIRGGDPLMAADVAADTTPPVLEWFTFDPRRGLLLLHFSEAIDPATVDVTRMVLQSMEQNVKDDFSTSRVVGNRTHNETVITPIFKVDESKVVRFTKNTTAYQLATRSLCNREFMPAVTAQESPRFVSLNEKFLCQVILGSYANTMPYTLYQHGIDMMVRLAPAEMAKLRSLAAANELGTRPQKTWLSVQGNPNVIGQEYVAKDYSGNSLVEIRNNSAKAMHKVDCSPCPQQQFLSRQCTVLEDRVCTKCTTCPYDHYANVECKPDEDTQCHRCTVCPYNYFVAAPCTGPQNTICSRCTECGWNEFETRPCEMGLDRTCQTCDSCSLSLMEKENNQEAKCRKSSLTWRQINCCWDTDGNQVKPCKDLGLQEFKISARDSRRDEVWCKRFDRDKKQCLDVMGGNVNVPVPSYGVEDTNRMYSDVNYN